MKVLENLRLKAMYYNMTRAIDKELPSNTILNERNLEVTQMESEIDRDV